jgi:hypothetical protein
MKSKHKTNRRKRKSRRRYIGGANDKNLRDKLKDIKLNMISLLLTNGNPEDVLINILPGFTTDAPYKRELSTIILLVGAISFQIQEFCFIYVKGGIATQFALHINKCAELYSTRDIDVFIKPTPNCKYDAKTCGELVAGLIVDVMNASKQTSTGIFIPPKTRFSSPPMPIDVIKIGYKPNNAPIVPMIDISFVEPPNQPLTTFVPFFVRYLPMVFYVPTIDNLIVEKMSYMYVYKDDNTIYYKQSLMRSLALLLACKKTDFYTLVDKAVYNLNLPEDDDDDMAKEYMLDQIKSLV